MYTYLYAIYTLIYAIIAENNLNSYTVWRSKYSCAVLYNNIFEIIFSCFIFINISQ